MRIPTGEIWFDLGNLSKILADGKLLVRSIFSLTCNHGFPQEKGKVTRSVLPVAQLQIKASIYRRHLCRASTIHRSKFNEIEFYNFNKYTDEGQGPIFDINYNWN